MRITNRILYGTVAILVALCTPGDASASTLGPEQNGKGVHLAVGFVGHRLDLQDRAYDALYDVGIDLARDGAGLELLAGYRFGPRLSLNLRLTSSEHDTGREDVKAGFGLAFLEVMAHMRPGERVQPYFTGGLGGGGIVLDPDEGDQVTLEGGAMTAGAGIDVLLLTAQVPAF